MPELQAKCPKSFLFEEKWLLRLERAHKRLLRRLAAKGDVRAARQLAVMRKDSRVHPD